MAKAIRADPSFCKYYWTAKNIDMLLHSIKVHVKVAKLTRNYCEEFLHLINQK